MASILHNLLHSRLKITAFYLIILTALTIFKKVKFFFWDTRYIITTVLYNLTNN